MIRSRSFWAQMSGWGRQLKYSRRAVRTFSESGRYNKPHRTATAGWPIASLALTMVHTPDFPVCSGAGRRRPIHRKLQGLPATRQGGELQRQRRDGQDHDRGSKSELAGASASSRSPPLTEAKAGRNCSAQDRPVAQPCFTRRPGVGPISLHEAKAFPGGAWEQN